ncbi:Adaptive-response sensory-kinase SasA [subsurface metagenome]
MYQMNPHAIPNLISAIFSIGIGIFVFTKNKRSKVYTSFLLLTITVFIWQLGTFLLLLVTEPKQALFWCRLVYIGAIFIPVTTFHFVTTFLGLKKQEKYVFLSYLLGALIFLPLSRTKYFLPSVYRYFWGYWFKAGFLHPLFLLFFAVLMLISFHNLFLGFKRAKLPSERVRRKYLFIALLIGYVGAVDYLPNYGIGVYPFGHLAVIICVLTIAYAIVTYRLMDIKMVMTRGGVLVGTYAFIIGVPALVASVGRLWLMGVMGDLWWVPPLGLFAGLALVGPFIALFLIQKLEAKDRERDRRMEEDLERTGQGMIEINDVERLVKLIPRYLTKFYYARLEVKITHATTSLLDKDRKEYVLKSTSGARRVSLERTLPEEENPISIWFEKIVPVIKEKRFVKQRELDVLQREDIDFWLKEERLLRLGEYIKPNLVELKKLMVELRAVLCVPSFYQDRLLGFLILGEKEKGLFNPRELALFFRLARYAALAIRSAQLSQDLQKAYATIAQEDRMSAMGQLAASFAHEINNPVAIIISGIELSLMSLRDDLLKAQSLEEKEKIIKDVEDKLEKIKGEAFRISHIIGRIMGYVRASDKDFTPLSLKELIETTLGLVQYPIRLRKIEVVKEIPEDLPQIRGVAGDLQEVFLNLFNNALEAMEGMPSGSINILARTVGNNPEMAEIKVADTGCGIPAENLRKVFNFLFTTKLQGTGVGLSVSYDKIRKHEGTMDVESEVGKGTTFTIRLPVWKKGE